MPTSSPSPPILPPDDAARDAGEQLARLLPDGPGSGRRRRGLAGAAVRLATGWALADPDVVPVQAWVHPHDRASLRTLERAGFAVEGVRRLFFGDADAVVLSRV